MAVKCSIGMPRWRHRRTSAEFQKNAGLESLHIETRLDEPSETEIRECPRCRLGSSEASNIRRSAAVSPVTGSEMSGLTRLSGVMEDDANGMALARAQAADAVTKVDPVITFGALHRAIMHGKCNGVALP
jgi:hypothetical protein